METNITSSKNRERTVFNDAQLYLLKVFSLIKSDEELDEIKKLITDYYFQKTENQLKLLAEGKEVK